MKLEIILSTPYRLFQQWLETGVLSFRNANNSDPMFQRNAKPEPSEGEITLDKLRKGESAVVKRLVTADSKNLQKLLAMGILPGRIIKVLQRYPAYILEVDRTQAAMDKELASQIILKERPKYIEQRGG